LIFLSTAVNKKLGGTMTPLVAVVDDDVAVRESLESLIRSVGMAVTVFASAEEFLNSAHPNRLDCLILDVRMPGMSGIELHRHLLASNCKVPAVFITAHASDDRARSEASSDWTVAYLAKPFSDDELLDAVHAASRLKSKA
jgi:FixJ family two-component response regulator